MATATKSAAKPAVKRPGVKLHEVLKYPDPVLARKADPVTVFDEKLAQFVDEMFDSMYEAQGIGLAAPQIGVSQRIYIVDCSFKKDPAQKLVLINPEIVDKTGEQIEEEGCLSLPDIREKVKRFAWVKMRAQNVKGEWFEIEGEELLSRALQHELDHLDGVLFIDRISRLKRELVLRKIRKLIKLGDW